eukprot:scaffold28353_cov129-Isochrysis_galbana.AAC.4
MSHPASSSLASLGHRFSTAATACVHSWSHEPKSSSVRQGASSSGALTRGQERTTSRSSRAHSWLSRRRAWSESAVQRSRVTSRSDTGHPAWSKFRSGWRQWVMERQVRDGVAQCDGEKVAALSPSHSPTCSRRSTGLWKEGCSSRPHSLTCSACSAEHPAQAAAMASSSRASHCIRLRVTSEPDRIGSRRSRAAPHRVSETSDWQSVAMAAIAPSSTSQSSSTSSCSAGSRRPYPVMAGADRMLTVTSSGDDANTLSSSSSVMPEHSWMTRCRTPRIRDEDRTSERSHLGIVSIRMSTSSSREPSASGRKARPTEGNQGKAARMGSCRVAASALWIAPRGRARRGGSGTTAVL